MKRGEEIDVEDLEQKRRFWRYAFWAGVVFFALILMITATKYASSMGEVKELTGNMADFESEMILLTERRKVLMGALKWFIPFAILASIWINVARYRLRKLKKLVEKAVV